MAYTRTVLFKVGETGLTVKAALMNNSDAIHATLRDLATSEKPVGSGFYRFTSAAWPNGYQGMVVAYVGTLAAATTFAGVTVKDASIVNPGDYESIAALAGGAAFTGPTVVVFNPDTNLSEFQLRIVAGDSYEDGDRLVRFTFEDYTGPSVSAAAGSFRLCAVVDYEATEPESDAPAELVSEATVTQDGTTVVFTCPMTAAQTDVLYVPKKDRGVYPTHIWQAVATLSGGKPITLKMGYAFVTRRITTEVEA